MARFYGSVQGSRGGVHRLGTPNSGMSTIAAGWSGAVSTFVYDKDGEDWVRVEFQPWRGRGKTGIIYDGPIGKDASNG